MGKTSAGLVVYRINEKQIEFFLVHPGGPFFRNRDAGVWSIVKGEFTSEDPLETAIREFEEETGSAIIGNFIWLEPIRQKAGKWVHAWAVRFDINASNIISNPFEMEWPPGSGKKQFFPEVDKAGWFTLEKAKEKINPAQLPLLMELSEKIKAGSVMD